jgi:diacylglycerol O-acyltransferase
MERMKGVDASLLYMETPSYHMHTLKIVVFDPPEVGPEGAFESARAELLRGLSLLPGFRRRMVELPLGFHHPVWVEDPGFDLDRHIHTAVVDAPGDRLAFDACVGRIASRPLHRDRPLWEVWIVTGLADGAVAGVVKVHHAMLDGVAASNLIEHALGGSAATIEEDSWEPERIPSAAVLVRDALGDHLSQVRRLPGLANRTLRNLITAASHWRAEDVRSPLPILDTPRTIFNTSLTPRREFASVALPLDAIRDVKKRAGVTVNDVALALVGGSLRRYLLARDALPDQSLVVEVPVAAESLAVRKRLRGNRLSNLFTLVRTDVEDPVERLEQIHRVTAAAKRTYEDIGHDLFQQWTEFAPPLLMSTWTKWASRHRLADRNRPAVNAIVSNVPGPRQPLSWMGQNLRELWSVGPILDGIGLNITLWSYGDRVHASALSCPDRIEGLHEITDGLVEELEALEA